MDIIKNTFNQRTLIINKMATFYNTFLHLTLGRFLYPVSQWRV